MQSPQQNPRKSIKELISGPAAVIVLLAFFLPWITISCEGGYGAQTFSGYDLSQDQTEGDMEREGDTLLVVIPLAALVVLVAVWLRYSDQIQETIASRIYIIVGAIGLIVQFLKYLSLQSDLKDAEQEVGQGVIDLSYRYGWWLSAIGLVAIIVAGFVAANRSEPTYGRPSASETGSGKEGP